MPLLPGTVFQGFRILARIGRGSYGNVYQTENLVTGQQFALKLVPLAGNAGRRELNALRVYQNIDHPNLLKVHHAGIAGEELYYTMDLAESPLADQHLSPAGLRTAAGKLADALSALHRAGLLHRDIKPDNLFWRGGEPVLGDIGLVTEQKNATLSGTPGFLPPKLLLHGKLPDPAADVYALAKSFYCLLSGNPPEKYPDYNGGLSPDAAILLDAVLTVCDSKNEGISAEGFRDMLQKPAAAHRHRIRRYAAAWLLLLLILPSAAAIIFSRKPDLRPAAPTKTPAEPPEYALLRQSLAEFDAASKRNGLRHLEQGAIAKALEEAGRRHAEKQLPVKNGKTSFRDILARENIARRYTLKKQQERADKDPAFRCFFLHWEKLNNDSILLRTAILYPKEIPFPETEFRAWRKKWQAYQQEAKALQTHGNTNAPR